MSFILDALKKSENDRQRQNGPALFENRVVAPRTRFPMWAIALAALLVVNLAVVGWLMLRRPASTDEPPAAQASSSSPASGSAAPPAVAGSPAPGQGAPPAQTYPPQPGYPQQQYQQQPPPGYVQGYGQQSYPPPNQAGAYPPPQGQYAQGQIGQQQPGAYGQPQQAPYGTPPPANAYPQANAFQQPNSYQQGPSLSEEGAPTANINPDDYAPASEPPPPGPFDSHVRRGTESGLPSYEEAATKTSIPPVRLDLHVYAADPTKRFVLVNMRRMREGESTPEGVKVDNITTDGAILSFRGTRFVLERD